jgi:hypothetical protein
MRKMTKLKTSRSEPVRNKFIKKSFLAACTELAEVLRMLNEIRTFFRENPDAEF